MATKEKVLNIHQRLNAVMADVNYIKKDKKIEIGKGSYSVTGHDAVTKLIHPLLVEHGINLIPSVVEMTQEGNRTRVLMSFDWINIDDPKDFFTNQCVSYGVDNQDKGPGKSISYAQRFITLKTLHLETGERDVEEYDVDFASMTKEENLRNKEEKMVEDFAKEVQETLSHEQRKEFVDHVTSSGIEVNNALELIKLHGYAGTKDIPVDKLEALKNEITFIAKGAANVGA